MKYNITFFLLLQISAISIKTMFKIEKEPNAPNPLVIINKSLDTLGNNKINDDTILQENNDLKNKIIKLSEYYENVEFLINEVLKNNSDLKQKLLKQKNKYKNKFKKLKKINSQNEQISQEEFFFIVNDKKPNKQNSKDTKTINNLSLEKEELIKEITTLKEDIVKLNNQLHQERGADRKKQQNILQEKTDVEKENQQLNEEVEKLKKSLTALKNQKKIDLQNTEKTIEKILYEFEADITHTKPDKSKSSLVHETKEIQENVEKKPTTEVEIKFYVENDANDNNEYQRPLISPLNLENNDENLEKLQKEVEQSNKLTLEKTDLLKKAVEKNSKLTTENSALLKQVKNKDNILSKKQKRLNLYFFLTCISSTLLLFSFYIFYKNRNTIIW